MTDEKNKGGRPRLSQEGTHLVGFEMPADLFQAFEAYRGAIPRSAMLRSLVEEKLMAVGRWTRSSDSSTPKSPRKRVRKKAEVSSPDGGA